MIRTALRLLLALCLVLTGTGNAVAAVAIHDAPHADDQIAFAAAAAILASNESAGSDCGHPAAASVPASVEAAAADQLADDPCDEGCCAHGGCVCACAQLAQADRPRVPMPADAAGTTNVVAQFPSGHPTPALPHLIRPPIG